MASKAERASDPLWQLAETLRGKGGVESRSAVLHGERVEFFRGKDFVRFLKATPEAWSKFASLGKDTDDSIRLLGELLMRREYVRRCDRVSRKPAPGATRLVKFPKKLSVVPPPGFKTFAESDFYAWLYDRPTSPWVYALAVAGAVVALLVCLFPLAPFWVKRAVLYCSASVLAALLGVLGFRSVLALATWIATGHTLWLLPNVMAEQLTVGELFTPLFLVEGPDDAAEGEEGSKEGGEGKEREPGAAKGSSHLRQLAMRAGVGAILAGVMYFLYAHAPDKERVAKQASQYRDEVFDFFNIREQGYQRIGASSAGAPEAATAGVAADAAATGGDGQHEAPHGSGVQDEGAGSDEL